MSDVAFNDQAAPAALPDDSIPLPRASQVGPLASQAKARIISSTAPKGGKFIASQPTGGDTSVVPASLDNSGASSKVKFPSFKMGNNPPDAGGPIGNFIGDAMAGAAGATSPWEAQAFAQGFTGARKSAADRTAAEKTAQEDADRAAALDRQQTFENTLKSREADRQDQTATVNEAKTKAETQKLLAADGSLTDTAIKQTEDEVYRFAHDPAGANIYAQTMNPSGMRQGDQGYNEAVAKTIQHRRFIEGALQKHQPFSEAVDASNDALRKMDSRPTKDDTEPMAPPGPTPIPLPSASAAPGAPTGSGPPTGANPLAQFLNGLRGTPQSQVPGKVALPSARAPIAPPPPMPAPVVAGPAAAPAPATQGAPATPAPTKGTGSSISDPKIGSWTTGNNAGAQQDFMANVRIGAYYAVTDPKTGETQVYQRTK